MKAALVAAGCLAARAAAQATPSPSGRPFAQDSILVLRGGADENTVLQTGQAQRLALLEYGLDGVVRSVRDLPTVTAGEDTRCTMFFGAGGYQLDGFLQRSLDQSLVTFPCNDVEPGTTQNNITGRVVGVAYANGTVSTSQVVRSAFRDSTATTLYRTIASVGPSSGFWMTGSTSSADSNGMHYVPPGSAQSVRVATVNAANQRFVHVGPSWPGSGQPPSVPQLYMSVRDGLGVRGVHSVGSGLPTTFQPAGSTLLPGFELYQVAINNLTTPLIGSFHFEPDGRRIWASDTQGWQTLVPAPVGDERINLVEFYWEPSVNAFRRGMQMSIDPPVASNGYPGSQIQLIHGRMEDGVWTIYTVNNLRLMRIVPSQQSIATLAANTASGYYFISSAFAPFVPPTPSPTPSSTASGTASLTNTPSGTNSPGASGSNTGSRTASPPASESASRTPSNSETGSVPGTPSLTRSRTASQTFVLTQSVTRSSDATRSRTVSVSARASATRTRNSQPSVSPSYRPVAPVRVSFSVRFAFAGSHLATQQFLAEPLVRQAKKDIICALASAVNSDIPGPFYNPRSPFFARSDNASIQAYVTAMIDGASGLRVPFNRGDSLNSRTEYLTPPCPPVLDTRRVLRAEPVAARRRLQDEPAGESLTVSWVVEVSRPGPPPDATLLLLASDPAAVNKWERAALTTALGSVRGALSSLTSRENVLVTMRGVLAALAEAPYEVAAADVDITVINATRAGTAADPFFLPVEDARDFSVSGGGGGGDSSGVGAAIGGAVGGVLLALVILGALLFYHRKKQIDAANASLAASNAAASGSGAVHQNKMHHSRTSGSSLLSDQPTKKKAASDVSFDAAFSEESRASAQEEREAGFGQSNPLSRSTRR